MAVAARLPVFARAERVTPCAPAPARSPRLSHERHRRRACCPRPPAHPPSIASFSGARHHLAIGLDLQCAAERRLQQIQRRTGAVLRFFRTGRSNSVT